MNDSVTFSTDYWSLTLPLGWKNEPTSDHSVTIASADETKKIFLKTLVPKANEGYNSNSALAQFEEIIFSAHRKTLNSTHKRFLRKQNSQPPYTTLLLASFDPPAQFGIATMVMVAPDHQINISIHDYCSEGQAMFEQLFQNILKEFRLVACE